jgi:hypothetical protein
MLPKSIARGGVWDMENAQGWMDDHGGVQYAVNAGALFDSENLCYFTNLGSC